MSVGSIKASGVRRETLLRSTLQRCRGQFAIVLAFSLIVNVLQLTTSFYMLQVYDRVLASRSADTLLFLTIITIAALLLLAMLEAARSQIMQRTATWMEQTVAPEGFARAIENQLRGSPYRMEALRDLAALRGFLSSGAMLAIYDVPWVPIYLAVIFILHPALGWVATSGAAVLVALTLINEASTSALLRKSGAAASASLRRSENVARNAEVIDSMGMLPAVLARWHRSIVMGQADQIIASNRASWVLAATKFVRLSVQVAVLGVGALLVLENEMTAGAMIAASIIMGRSLAPVESLISGWKHLVATRGAWQRLKGFFAQPRLRPEGVALPMPAGRLVAERVTYSFPGQSVPTIQNVSFALEPGTCLAVIGPSAAGKTTLVRLLTGTVQPLMGNVRLDGADVFNWPREDFGKYVGYLPQDVELFEGTVFENIARLQSAEPEQVYEAAKLAGCHEMILRLPQGYETEIGESGAYLSGGQRQMIGLARALFGEPKIVILDEPNSNLDSDGEAALISVLAALKDRGTTVVLVSHRPGIVQKTDKVMLLRAGAVEAFGARDEVLKPLLAPRPAGAPSRMSGAPSPVESLGDRRAAQ